TGRFVLTVETPSGEVADQALLNRNAGVVLRIPSAFERDLRRGVSPQVQLILNAEDGAAAGVVLSYAQNIVADFGREWAAGAGIRTAVSGISARGLTIQTRKLYNP